MLVFEQKKEQLVGWLKPNNFLSAKTVQFCARLMQKCAKKCKKSHFWSSLDFDSQLTSNRQDLVLLG